MSSGLYSGFPGLAQGYGLYDNSSGLWNGGLGLSGDPQFLLQEDNSFLLQENGDKIVLDTP